MKLYYGALALIWLLSGCEPTQYDNVSSSKTYDGYLGTMVKVTYEGHEYMKSNQSFTHLGTCKQCKFELDSIVKNAVNEAFEAYGREDWNE